MKSITERFLSYIEIDTQANETSNSTPSSMGQVLFAEMLEKEKQFKEELFNLRFQLATGQLENTARLKEVRKSIARIKTVLRQKELNK